MRTDDRERPTSSPAGPGVDAVPRRAAEWGSVWRGLELPPVAPPPPGFAARVAARARAEERAALGLPLSPVWARAAAALVLVAGVVGGAGLGLAVESPEAESAALAWNRSTLADEYLEEAGTAVEDAAVALDEERER